MRTWDSSGAQGSARAGELCLAPGGSSVLGHHCASQPGGPAWPRLPGDPAPRTWTSPEVTEGRSWGRGTLLG